MNPIIRTLTVLLPAAPLAAAPEPIRELDEAAIHAPLPGGATIADRQRGFVLYNDTFNSYPTSDDPVFDRFQISLQGRSNGTGATWTSFDKEYLPSLFVAGQLNDQGDPDPLPRWFGADLIENNNATILGDLTGDLAVDTADLGVLLGAFGEQAPTHPADLNGDGVVDTADLGLMISRFGDSLGPFCLYRVTLAREETPEGGLLSPDVLAASPQENEIIAVPTSAAECGACDQYRFQSSGQAQPVYGVWELIESDAMAIDEADYLAASLSQQCDGWGDEAVLALARSESSVLATNCCFYSLFTPLATQTSATPVRDVVTQVDVFLTGHQTFLWLQGMDNGLRVGWDVMLGGVAQWLDPNLLPFERDDGNLHCFIVRQSPQVPGAGQGLFFGTVPDQITGAVGKDALIGEWFTLRMVQKSDSTFELWVRDSETLQLEDPLPASDTDGVTDDGYARLVPGGPYGPAIWNMQPGVAAPNPFLVATPALRQVQWLWGGDPSPEEDPDYEPANWYMDNIRIEGPF